MFVRRLRDKMPGVVYDHAVGAKEGARTLLQ